MSVYTPVSLEEANILLRRFAIGHALRLEGITEGVVNSNFRLITDQGPHILTLIENPEQGRQLPWLVTLLELLGAAGVPSPLPIRDRQHQAIHELHHKACLLVTHLAGGSPRTPLPGQCRQVGEVLGRIHTLKGHALPRRDNPMGFAKWYILLHQLTPRLAPLAPATVELLHRELLFAQQLLLDPQLPTGICHADLFPDNTLFVEQQLTGVIDFHFACHEKWLYDLAITLNAWCFTATGTLEQARLRALFDGYLSQRPLTALEWQHLDHACRTAALRFALTRLHAQLFPREGQQVTRKPPEEYLTRIAFHQTHSIRHCLGE